MGSERKKSRQSLGVKNLFGTKIPQQKVVQKEQTRVVLTKVFTARKQNSPEQAASGAWPQPGRHQQPRGQDWLSEGMQKSSAPKPCPGHAGVSRATPASTGYCCALIIPGPPTLLQAQDQAPDPEGLFNSTSPIFGCHQPQTRLPYHGFGHQQDARATAPNSHGGFCTLGAGYQPCYRGGSSTLGRSGSNTQDPGVLFSVAPKHCHRP